MGSVCIRRAVILWDGGMVCGARDGQDSTLRGAFWTQTTVSRESGVGE